MSFGENGICFLPGRRLPSCKLPVERLRCDPEFAGQDVPVAFRWRLATI